MITKIVICYNDHDMLYFVMIYVTWNKIVESTLVSFFGSNIDGKNFELVFFGLLILFSCNQKLKE